MYALDFVALLLSLMRPAAAEMSMSRSLKEIVPLGTLGADKLKLKPKDMDIATKQVVKGWKAESLRSAAQSLLDASNRLSEEAEREEKYWNEILKIKDAGWAICRIPRETQTLGVRYGFAEGMVASSMTR